ncbi:hypothetical protein TNCV_912091 [Trichonephila clavipes]|nr:hypothetical protein TNCV_912091 [Trichonephila clavipes]
MFDEFSTIYKNDYEVERDGKNFLKISLQALHNVRKISCNDVDGSSALSCQSICWNLCELVDELIFWSCKLLRKIPVNHNTYLLTFLLPPGTKMWVPIGCHVHIKSYIEGVEVIRSYTPVISSLATETNPFDESDGCKLVLMIKGCGSSVVKVSDRRVMSSSPVSLKTCLVEGSDACQICQELKRPPVSVVR